MTRKLTMGDLIGVVEDVLEAEYGGFQNPVAKSVVIALNDEGVFDPTQVTRKGETMTKTTTTYALPDEPEGPVWDSFGKRWTPTDVDGWWLRDVTGGQCSWARVLEGYGPLTSTPPWEPEVGGTVETAEQYAALPEGSIVEDPSGNVYWLTHEGPWLKTGSSNMSGCAELAGTPRTILRVGWSG